MARAIDTLSAGITGEGTMDLISYGALRDRMLAAEPFNVRVTLDLPGASGGGYFQWQLRHDVARPRQGGQELRVGLPAELASNGAIAWVDAA